MQSSQEKAKRTLVELPWLPSPEWVISSFFSPFCSFLFFFLSFLPISLFFSYPFNIFFLLLFLPCYCLVCVFVGLFIGENKGMRGLELARSRPSIPEKYHIAGCSSQMSLPELQTDKVGYTTVL